MKYLIWLIIGVGMMAIGFGYGDIAHSGDIFIVKKIMVNKNGCLSKSLNSTITQDYDPYLFIRTINVGDTIKLKFIKSKPLKKTKQLN